MRAKVTAVTPSATKTIITVELDHRAAQDFIYDPPSKEVREDPAAFKAYQKEVTAARTAHIDAWKTGDRPGKDLIGKMVSIGA